MPKSTNTNIRKIMAVAPPALLWMALAGAKVAVADPLSLQQVIQETINHYPSLRTAALQVEKARQNTAQIEARLGWQLAAQGGVAKDTSAFGTGVKRVDAGATLSRQLASGDSIAVNGMIRREDSEVPLSPNLPDPVTSTNLEVNYRKPLRKGADNPEYQLALSQSEIGVLLAQAEQKALYDQLAAQVMEIYLAAIVTRGRIDNVQQSLKYTERLQQFIKSRFNLGIAEDKDQLQVVAQYDSQQAQLKALELAWEQQRIGLNRLMGRPWDAPVAMQPPGVDDLPAGTLEELITQAGAHSPALQRITGQLRLAEDAMLRQHETRKDKFDVVSFLGNRSSVGDSANGNADNTEWVGGVRVEFQRGLDQSGNDAALYQAQLDRDIALQTQHQVLEDLHYDIAGLLSEIKAAQISLDAYARSTKSQRAQLEEADARYRKGRIDIDRVIQFETQLAAGELALALQQIELSGRIYRLSLLRGQLWQGITLPAFTFTTDEQHPQETP